MNLQNITNLKNTFNGINAAVKFSYEVKTEFERRLDVMSGILLFELKITIPEGRSLPSSQILPKDTERYFLRTKEWMDGNLSEKWMPTSVQLL